MNVTMMQKKTNWMSVQTMEIVKKKRETKAKKDTNLKKEKFLKPKVSESC